MPDTLSDSNIQPEATTNETAPAQSVVPIPVVTSEEMTRALASLATQAWKLHQKLSVPDNVARDDMRRLARPVENMYETFLSLGLEIKDHTGDTFNYGLPLKVVTAQPMPGIPHERVIETLKPTIYWHKQLIQAGEVVIATPA